MTKPVTQGTTELKKEWLATRFLKYLCCIYLSNVIYFDPSGFFPLSLFVIYVPLDTTANIQQKGKIGKLDYIEVRNFCVANDTIKKGKSPQDRR